jgi:hypothetical protein
MGVYSFLNVNATIAGAGGSFNMASGAAAAEEGITVAAAEDKNIMTMGADGNGQHSLVASDAGQLTVRLLKTSPVNAQLMAMYNLQSSSSALWGANLVTLTDSSRGDFVACQGVAFKKVPDLNYAKEGGFNEWVFDALKIDRILGT